MISQGQKRKINLLLWGNFIRAMQFWYPVEIVFMISKGISIQRILWLASIRGLVSILLEVPTGTLADIWGYKRVMMLSTICMSASGAMYILFPNYVGFILATTIWTASVTSANGTREGYIHFILGEDDKQEFSKYYGRMNAMALWGIGFASVIGSLIAVKIGYIWPFLISIPIPLLSLLLFAKLPEHKATKISSKKLVREYTIHTWQATRYVFTHAPTMRIMIALTVFMMSLNTFAQIRHVAYAFSGVSIAWFGAVDMLRFLVAGQGNAMAHKLRIKSVGRLVFYSSVILAISLIISGTVRHPLGAVMLCLGSFVIGVNNTILKSRLQDKIDGKLRAATNSVVSMINSAVWSLFMLIISFTAGSKSIPAVMLSLAAITTLYIVSMSWKKLDI